MPIAMEKLKDEIWNKFKGKTNPRTKKPYTESDAYAIAQSIFKAKEKQ
jgi:hypothetical protein